MRSINLRQRLANTRTAPSATSHKKKMKIVLAIFRLVYILVIVDG